jgi:putative ABC transport system permease protein
MTPEPDAPLLTRRFLRPSALLYFYRRRLRAHGTQELLAGIGIAAAVALVLAAVVAQGSIAGANRRVLRAVIGPADLQLRARGPEGFPEALLTRVEALPGVKQAAAVLERSLRVTGPRARSATIYIAGTDTSLAVLNGLGHTLPLNTLNEGAIGLSIASARALGITGDPTAAGSRVRILVGGRSQAVPVSSVLGPEAVGALAGAKVGVMALTTMQTLLGDHHSVTRILVQSMPGKHAEVLRGLERISAGRMTVSPADQEITLLEQALRPSAQASDLFAIIGALLGFLLAFNAILLTVPERRQAIADLRLSGTTRPAIVQLALFQALALGLAASAAGLGVGYLLSRLVFAQSTSYLGQAFVLAGGTVVPAITLVLAAASGVLITCIASAVPLLDLRRNQPRDAIYVQPGVPGNALGPALLRWLGGGSLVMLAAASALYLAAPSSALIATVFLAVATVLAAPVTFALVLTAARALSDRAPRLSTLALALGGVRGTTLRSIALAATGAVALFGSVALGGARANLLSGIHGFSRSYAADAPIWVGEPAESGQATGQLAGDGDASRMRSLPGVASVSAFQGTFMTLGSRRVWVIARPPGRASNVLATQTIGGRGAASVADVRLAEGGWVAVSEQVASEQHAAVGETITLPTPAGHLHYRVAALTTNLAWPPGVIFMSTADYSQAWGTTSPSALAVDAKAGVPPERIRHEIVHALGSSSGLEVLTAPERQARIDALTGEGLSQLGIVSTLLILAAIMSLAAALGSSIYQRRAALAGLRLAGAPPARLRRILLTEATLILGAGCITGALAGFYGQYIIDAYLRHVTGFPVASAGASIRPFEIFAIVLAAALAAVAIPALLASKVPPALALAEE